MTGDLFLSPAFRAALRASGRTNRAIAVAIAPMVGSTQFVIENLLACRSRRVPHNNGRNTIIAAVCEHIGFPIEQALTATKPTPIPPPRRETTASIEAAFERARRTVRAMNLRLSDEDIYMTRNRSPYGSPDKDEEAA